MEPTDTTAPVGPARLTGPWLTLGLVAALAFLLLSTYSSMRTEKAADMGANSRLIVDALVQAREYHLSVGIRTAVPRHNGHAPVALPATHRDTSELVLDMRQLATSTKTASAWRCLAIVEAMIGSPEWRHTITRIPRAAPDEPAMWEAVFGAPPVDPVRARTYAARLEGMDLGWYRRIASESLYRNAHMVREAERERELADRGFYSLTIYGMLGVLLSLLAVVAAIVLGIIVFVQRWDRSVVLPAALEATPPPPLSRDKANVLYAGFVTYLGAFIGVRYVRMALVSLFPGLTRLASGASAVLSLPLLILVVAAPLFVIWLLGRRVGLRAADLGYRGGRVFSDIACGVWAWLATLPLLATAMVISSRVFRGYESPDNPAITEFTGVRSATLQVLLFVIAAIYAPLAEETMFRGVFMRSLAPRLGVGGAIVVASAVFAILHPQLPIGFAGIFILGMLFSVLYQMRGSLISSITAHALNNASIFVLLSLLLAE